MLSRAQVLAGDAVVQRFHWERDGAEHPGVDRSLYIVNEDVPVAPQIVEAEPHAAPASPAMSPAEQDAHLAALERDAFSKGYASGERAGVEAGARRADAMLRRVAQTLESLTQLRRTIIRETERQVVELALTLARRVVVRELSTDPELVAALAHVALDRLGEQAPAVIRLNPEDYATVSAQRGEQWEGAQVTVVPDPAIPRGGCTVESDFGVIDASVDAQFAELSRELLGDSAAAPVVDNGR